jgi:hypothetical protein
MTPVKKQLKLQPMHKDAWWQTRHIEELIWSEIWDEIAGKVQDDRTNPLLQANHQAIVTKL